MAETKREREARHKAILDALNAPGGRERSNDDIAAQFGCNKQSVAYVRSRNPTPEAVAASMKALDECGLFPGIYQWHMERQARKNAPSDGLGVNSPNFGRLLTSEDLLKQERGMHSTRPLEQEGGTVRTSPLEEDV